MALFFLLDLGKSFIKDRVDYKVGKVSAVMVQLEVIYFAVFVSVFYGDKCIALIGLDVL